MERDAGLFQNDFLQSLRGALALQDASAAMGQVDGEGVPVLLRCAAAKKAVEVIIQSPMGGNITPEAILAKVGKADKIYIRVDENKAYWVRGKETGSVDLWD